MNLRVCTYLEAKIFNFIQTFIKNRCEVLGFDRVAGSKGQFIDSVLNSSIDLITITFGTFNCDQKSF